MSVSVGILAKPISPTAYKNVVRSIKRAPFKSTINPKCSKKSAPIIGIEISVITNVHENSRRKPRLMLSVFVPNMLIGVLFAAYKFA